MRSSVPQILKTIMSCGLLLVVGCSKFSADYGKTSGNSAYTSINGYGTFRAAIKNAGFSDREMNRLTDRLKKNTDLVVWAPQNTTPLNTEAVAWIDSWLTQPNRTLIYISPDSGSEVEYWTTTMALAPAEKRMEYRRRAATSQTQRRQNRFKNRKPPSYDWFTISELSQPETIKGVAGPWAPNAAKTFNTNTEVTGTIALPATPLEYEVSTALSPKDETTNVLLETNKSTAYVAKVTSNKWNGSQIFVISSGSLLSNFGLTQRPNQLLADKIIQAAASAKNSSLRAGFLNNNGTPLTVSDASNGAPVPSGMEFLTVWPISLLTMHGIFLGFVICLMLLPIFGRPRRILNVNSANFGHHLDAVASLMNRVGGERYARTKISEYMKRVRGETAGPWILNEAPTNAVQPAQNLRPRRLSDKAASEVNAGETQQAKSQPNATETPEPPMSSEGKSARETSQPDGKKLE